VVVPVGSVIFYIFIVYLVPSLWVCHSGMVHAWVVVGEDNLQIWRVAANILNKSQTADKG
jgi:hypothetical protein